jgi:hypothetical protein
MHVAGADRAYENISATAAQRKNHKYRPLFGGPTICTQSLFGSLMCFVGQDSNWPIKHAFNDFSGYTVLLTFLEVATVPIEAQKLHANLTL